MSTTATLVVQLGLGGSYAGAVMDDAPYYYHRLDELSGTVAVDAMNRTDGTYAGTPAMGAASPLAEGGFAVTFDGVDDVVSATAPSKPSTFSIDAWMYSAAWAAGVEPIVQLQTGATPNYFYVEGGVLKGTLNTAAGQITATGSAVATSTWVHVALAWDGTNVRLYKNGVLDATSAAHSGILTTFDVYRIGRFTPNVGIDSWFSGLIDEVAYYSEVVLSLTRCLAHYNAALWTAVTADVRDAVVPQIRYGITGVTPLDRVASPGSCVFALDNSTSNSAATKGYYSPDHASARANFDVGIPVRVGLTHAGTTYYKFRGVLTDIHPTPSTSAGPWLTHVTAMDFMDEFQRTHIDTIPIQLAQTASTLVKKLIDNTTRKPAAVSIGTTSETYPYVFDNSNDEGLSLLTEAQRLALSEFGFVYAIGDTTAGGTLVFESRAQRSAKGTDLSTLTDASYVQSEQAFQVSRSRNNIVNRVLVTVHPRKVDAAATTVLFKLTDTNTVIEIGSGATVSIVCPFTDPAQRDSRVGGTAMVTPVATTDYLMNAQSDGGGANTTADLVIVTEFGANAAFLELTNNNAATGYVTQLQLRGKGIYDMQRVLMSADDNDSQARFGTQSFVYEMPYQSSPSIARDAADYMLNIFGEQASQVLAVTVPGGESSALMTVALAREVGDRIRLTETQTGISGSFFINAVGLTLIHIGANQVDVQATFTVTPAAQYGMWLLETVGVSELGTSTFIGF